MTSDKTTVSEIVENLADRQRVLDETLQGLHSVAFGSDRGYVRAETILAQGFWLLGNLLNDTRRDLSGLCASIDNLARVQRDAQKEAEAEKKPPPSRPRVVKKS